MTIGWAAGRTCKKNHKSVIPNLNYCAVSETCTRVGTLIVATIFFTTDTK